MVASEKGDAMNVADQDTQGIAIRNRLSQKT
jgi:hypothetical protein